MVHLSILHARIITPTGVIEDGCVVIRDGKIHQLLPPGAALPDGPVLDAGGNWLAPGFIDIHVHGGWI